PGCRALHRWTRRDDSGSAPRSDPAARRGPRATAARRALVELHRHAARRSHDHRPARATTYGDWGEISYVFGPRWWGQGLASESTHWLLHHLADQGTPELWAAVDPDNEPSQRLLLRIGFLQVSEPTRALA